MPPTSAIPFTYYAIFAIYEPFIIVVGTLGAMLDPKTTHDSQAPWPAPGPPPGALPPATLVTIAQLAHVCTLLGVLNVAVLSAARTHLAAHPQLQEKVVRAFLGPLVVGDVAHIVVTLWGVGDSRWDVNQWSPLLWLTVVLGLTLLVPRVAWHLGLGRYVHSRDGAKGEEKKAN